MVTRNAALAAAIVLALAGCTTVPEEDRTAPSVESRDIPRGAAPSAQASASPRTGVSGARTGTPPSSTGKGAAGVPGQRAVYFDYDQFDVKPEFRPVIEAHARYLQENGGAKTVIQGHADERGSREYNVALGQRRAESVKKMLTLLGASEKQIEAVSLGEEKPSCADHSENCWSQNRRGALLYPGEY